MFVNSLWKKTRALSIGPITSIKLIDHLSGFWCARKKMSKAISGKAQDLMTSKLLLIFSVILNDDRDWSPFPTLPRLSS